MSRREEVEAYSKILKFQNKRYGTNTRDVIVLIIGIIILIVGTFWLSGIATPEFATLFFIIMAFYLLILAISFFDFAFGFGLFVDRQIVYVGVIVLFTVLLSTAGTIFATTLFIPVEGVSPDVLALGGMGIYLAVAFIISYFINTATPTRQGREEMIRKLTEIKNDIEKVPVNQLGSKAATTRGLKWLQFQQRDDGIWGEENPLYETSQVLRTFSSLNQGLNYKWKRIINGKEEVRTVEQTYFLVLEALDTASIEPNYEMLLPFQVVTTIDPSQVSLDSEAFIDFKDELAALSEWEFVQSLEDFNQNKSQISDIPIIFPMSLIFYLKENLNVAQQCADIFSQTFDILIRRAQTRFTIQGEKDVSKLLLGMMYNSLIIMLRGFKRIGSGNILDEYEIDDDANNSALEDLDSNDLEIPSLDFDMGDNGDDEGPSMPSFDFDDDGPAMPSFDIGENTSAPSTQSSADGFDISLPDPSMGLDDDEDQPDKIKIEISMASIRNYIRSLQSIDGSWGSSIETTAECLYAVLDQESPESNFIKLGLHYLLALQEKNGSWGNDIVLTSKVLKVLLKINQSMSLGGF